MTILNAPAAQAYFGRPVGFVVTILVGYEEKIRRCAKPEAAKADRDGARKRDVFEKDAALVKFPVAIRIFKDEDAAAAIGRETLATCFIVAVFRNPETAAVIPAKCVGLRDHRLDGGELHLEAGVHGHPIDCIFAGDGGGCFSSKAHGLCVDFFTAEFLP